MDCLVDYIRDTCDYCTDYQLPNLQFALNHRGTPDVALFDFTSMYAARNSVYVKERRGSQLLSFIIGDGLLEVNYLHCVISSGQDWPFYILGVSNPAQGLAYVVHFQREF